MSLLLKVSTAILLLSIYLLYKYPRANIPNHLLNHKYLQIEKIIPDEIGLELNKILRELHEYPTNINADLRTGYTGAIEDIGEGIEILSNGNCNNSLLVPNIKKTACILPQRIDIGKHFIMTGGPDAIRENVKDMTTRVQSFAHYLTGESLNKYSIINELFNSSHFINAAKTICPKDEQILDPFQFTFLLQIPGQTGKLLFVFN